MTIVIKGDNNGIAVEGSLKIEHLDFEFGKGIKSVSGVHVTTKEEETYDEAEEIIEEDNASYNPLSSDKAMAIWQKLRNQHLVDKHNKPLMSHPRAAILAVVISQKLDLNPKWTFLEKLWGIEDLATLHSKAKERNYYAALFKEYSNLLS
ncbi:MAG: hypothetical protein MR421_10435 [Prevotella sp.]|nr:hypothetical protein [Prevotella sp.]